MAGEGVTDASGPAIVIAIDTDLSRNVRAAVELLPSLPTVSDVLSEVAPRSNGGAEPGQASGSRSGEEWWSGVRRNLVRFPAVGDVCLRPPGCRRSR